MTRLTVDREMLAKLRDLDRPAGLCDETGVWWAYSLRRFLLVSTVGRIRLRARRNCCGVSVSRHAPWPTSSAIWKSRK